MSSRFTFMRWGGLAAVIAASALAASSAMAQTWPTKNVQLLVGTGAGGNPDAIARLFQAHMAKQNKTVVVENRTGGGGSIALRALVQGNTDGHMMMSGASATHPIFSKDAGYQPNEIVPVSVVGISQYGLLASPSTGFKTLADLVAYGKANPGKLNFAVIPATSHEVEVNEVINKLGIQAATIPYKGMPEVYTALIAGDIHATLHSNGPLLQAGKVHALAFAGSERQPEVASVPTFKELGIDFNPGVKFVFYAKAGTPKDLLNKMADEVSAMVKSQEFKDKITKPLGIVGAAWSPEESAKYVKDDYERVRAGAQRLGIGPK